jgi:diketogulonate reductase-like aldo/keto reductase
MPGATLDLIYQTFIANGEIPLERVLMHHPLPIHMWRDMERAVRLGYTKTIGISNIDVRTLHCLLGCAEIMPGIVKSELHPFLTDLDQTLALISYCRDHNIRFEAHSVLGGSKRFIDQEIPLVAVSLALQLSVADTAKALV